MHYNRSVMINGDDNKLININLKRIMLLISMIPLGIFTSGCANIHTVERGTDSVIENDFSNESEIITNELDTYDEYQPVFLEDNQQVSVESYLKQFIKQDKDAIKAKLDVNTLDFQVFEGPKDTYFIACVVMSADMPFTIFLEVKSSDLLEIKTSASHMAAYGVNISKTFLLYKGDEFALISQRPFSTFEEVYFFKVKKNAIDLTSRGWHDSSIIYYDAINKLLDEGKYDEAMNLPDESMYPMSYEKQLFETANHMVNSILKVAKDETMPSEKRIDYMSWALNYYFQNHYGMELEEAATGKFASIKAQSSDDFGVTYCLTNQELGAAIEAYANLLAKNGKESTAEQLRTSAKDYLNN